MRQQSEHDGTELLHHVWLSPEEALARNARGELNLLHPTIKTLQALARFKTVDEALAYACADRAMPAMTPRAATSRSGSATLFWGDYAYAEVGKLDPGGTGASEQRDHSRPIRQALAPRYGGSLHRKAQQWLASGVGLRGRANASTPNPPSPSDRYRGVAERPTPGMVDCMACRRLLSISRTT